VIQITTPEECSMHRRRAAVVAALAALPLVLAGPPAGAAPPPGHARPVTSGHMEGDIARMNTHLDKMVLKDRTRFLYDGNDHVLFQHAHDVETEDGDITCDVLDTGGEELVKAYVLAGFTVFVRADLILPRSEESLVNVVVDTCDGVVRADDVTLSVL
jgi:hypothetical protein